MNVLGILFTILGIRMCGFDEGDVVIMPRVLNNGNLAGHLLSIFCGTVNTGSRLKVLVWRWLVGGEWLERGSAGAGRVCSGQNEL